MLPDVEAIDAAIGKDRCRPGNPGRKLVAPGKNWAIEAWMPEAAMAKLVDSWVGKEVCGIGACLIMWEFVNSATTNVNLYLK